MADMGYRIDIAGHRGRVVAFRGDQIVAATDQAMILRETRLADTVYFPIEAIDPRVLTPSQHRTFCPFKGTATYWNVIKSAGADDTIEKRCLGLSNAPQRGGDAQGVSLLLP